ncbi:manganese resistance protein MNR2 [Magnaporthiopsis poae ATCC 64411]|uniref:Manganese resistance protein MNR2 n=1 Tax=Magnaporthiopsis poae (strain ATCC 64411 / 73-15) TaxID=644358 RepID=A0A0C4DVQ1_MAGP6|nr:manganese resistance protein MNR2 [Magnaporthiopsis poae ATCC 64411]
MDTRDPVAAAASAGAGPAEQPSRRKRTHRAGKKKKKARRKSFAVPSEDMGHDDLPGATGGDAFYSHPSSQLSNTSLDSVALLDHREQSSLRPRRPSIAVTTGSSFTTHSSQQQTPKQTQPPGSSGLRTVYRLDESGGEDGNESDNEGAPLLAQSARLAQSEGNLGVPGYGSNDHGRGRSVPRIRTSSGISFDKKKTHQSTFTPTGGDSYHVNYPPSVPGSPVLRPSDPTGLNFGDDLLRDEISRSEAMLARGDHAGIDPERAASLLATPLREGATQSACRPRRTQLEKEGRNHERRVKRITEPQLINGRLRPVDKKWFRADEDAPYRFTYFNEDFQSTIHSQTISELVQPGGSFRELFIPDPVILEDSSSEDEDEDDADPTTVPRHPSGPAMPVGSGWGGDSRAPSRQASVAIPSATMGDAKVPTQTQQQRTLSPTAAKDFVSAAGSTGVSGRNTPVPAQAKSPTPPEGKPLRYGDRPVWWLDVLSPTEAEMRVISKTFGIHPLTAEDIIMQEAREKVELFRHYYFVNYRSFDQDESSESFLDPVNMYVVVFREGIITFHFSLTPHPANVRRRVRQLRDYMMLSADWISYAIIDDITDVFVPLIQKIEDDVDEIDDEVLGVRESSEEKGTKSSSRGKDSDRDSATLRRIGDCRKKVMGLYRLLGNKADVIKGFAKRCNEHWEVAPRSDIGLYLGDIQDHIITMTGNLSHYEKILARSHGNYLAQINLRMNERQEETADILGKLTILGTIVLPMNLVTGLWGMNVWVPGQEKEGDLRWFFWITTSLISGGLLCFWVVKKAYGL